MKILITTDLYLTATNGVVTSLCNLRRGLEKKGHEVRILSISDRCKSYTRDGVFFIRSLPFPVYPDVRMPMTYRHKLIRELIRWKPDVIHSQCEFFSFPFARYISKKTGAPLVHTYHTLYEQYTRYVMPGKRLGKWLARSLSRHCLNRTDAVIAPTGKIEDTLLSYRVKTPIAVIPSGIDLQQHYRHVSHQSREELRRQLGITRQPVMLYLGRLGGEKNIQELISFYAKAVRQLPELRLVIVGDGPARPQLEKQAAEARLPVIFTGMVEPQRVHEYYQAGDVFVSASTSETQGLTYVEAAANGLPLLCRQDPCLKGILRQGENGFAYTTEEEFLQGIRKIVTDEAWRQAAGLCSRQLSGKFDKEAFADAVEQVYLACIGAGAEIMI